MCSELREKYQKKTLGRAKVKLSQLRQIEEVLSTCINTSTVFTIQLINSVTSVFFKNIVLTIT